MKTLVETKAFVPSRPYVNATPIPNALAHQAQLRQALGRAGVQPRLETNHPLEREADTAAERVVRMPKPLEKAPLPVHEQQRRQALRRAGITPHTEAGEASPQLESTLNSLNQGGIPMDASTRAFFEPRFGQDFSQVRLHTDNHAAHMANSLQAKAFTLGNNIVFAPRQYAPHSPAGKNLLGHELAHVVQQQGQNSHMPQAKRLQRKGSEGGEEKQKFSKGNSNTNETQPPSAAPVGDAPTFGIGVEANKAGDAI
ncbi:MAG: DUF4157 domain-containing protein [Proteobacteria bacterium]|nr:DUF4157 domain-containing protein [Cystobacterineae bacterium]MCL2258833.1 DUF4157 domain-containing protein [Cystobacterineae bacterium]MCL2314785.1 DUF4157 domain-containing protein [Pseudomonadota bacterium]